MKYLNSKLWRDIKRNWTQFFSVFLMAFLSVLVFVGLQGSWHGLEVSLEKYIESSHLPDSWLQSIGFTSEDIEKIENISGIDNVNAKIRIQTTVQTDSAKDKYIILDTFDNTDMVYNVNKGSRLDNNADGIWINKEYAEKNDVKVGDYIEVKYGDTKSSLNVLGILQSADRIYFTGTLEFMAPNYPNYGYGYISEEAIKSKLNYQGSPNTLEVYGENEELREKVEAILGNRYVTYYNRDTLVDVSEPLDRVGQIKNLSFMFSFIFILLAILAMYTTIRRLVETQTKEIAVLKAMGFSNRKIGIHYGSFGALVGCGGAILGIAIAPILSSFVLWTQKSMFSLPEWKLSYSLSSLIVILLVVAVCIVSAVFASKDAISGLPALFLRGTIEKKGRKFFLENIKNFWRKLKFENRWAIRDAAVNRVRLLMGIVGVTGGMMLLIVGFGSPDSINHLVDKAYSENFTYDKRLEVKNYEEALDKYEGQWVQISQARYSPDDGFNRLLIIISDGEYVNMKTVDGERIKEDGLYVTQGFADRAKLKKGDKLAVRPSLYDKEFEFTIAGIITSETNQGAYIMQKTWESAGGTFSPRTILTGPEITNDIIKDDTNIVGVIEINEQKDNAYVFVDSFMSVFYMIIGFAILLVVVVLYNLGSLNFAERVRDYATLRVLGFHKKELRNITMIENIATTFIGWVLGIPLGIWFLDIYVRTFSTIRLEYTSYLGVRTMVLATVVVWIASLTTTMFISRRIQRLDMVEALKGVE